MQDYPQLWPSMFIVLQMLIGEKDVNKKNIRKQNTTFDYVERS